ncbi:MAG: DUF2147 domain-containing protein [Segetibacter sp.]
MKYIVIILLTFFTSINVQAKNNPDAIIGKWIALPKKNVMVEVYRVGSEYKAKVAWFNDGDDKSKPMNQRMDEKNPDPDLRKRKLLGLEVLTGRVYNTEANRWERGKIYDAKSGRIWSSASWLAKDGTLQVRSFWHFEFMGQNMNFKKV